MPLQGGTWSGGSVARHLGIGPRTGHPRVHRRKAARTGESGAVDVGAGIVGLLAGLAVGPVADRIATNAPAGVPLLASATLSRRLALVTAAAGILAAASGVHFGFTFEALIAAFFCIVLVIITRTDIEHRLIPNRVVLPAAAVMVVARTLDDPSVEWVGAGLGAGLVLFLIVLAYPRGMGMGDVKLGVLLGAGLGTSVVVGLFLGFIAAFVPAAALLIRHGSEARKRAIPLGPFLALGGVIALHAGNAILDWYTDFGG
jgi:leader peptidase (prepilin peptidase) / N-methyltransferase